MRQEVFSVSQVNEYVRRILDNDAILNTIAVRGEISNYKLYPSGHHYFTIKDETAALKCVMFRGNAVRLRFRPENGMKIIAVGKVSVYPRDGMYQLYCTALTTDGVGDLQVAFDQLKSKLAAEGLFDPSHKKPLPRYPKTVGIVTSSAGAAVHDILRILRKRFPLTAVRLLPVRVQGLEAPEEICAAIAYANLHHLADVLIVGRGGGSIEDLWAFNDERVARAIFRSKIPVISAVGHEPDVTIADYVADVRAATPSNAAELAVPDQNVLRQTLDAMTVTLSTTVTRQLLTARRQLKILTSGRTMQDPTQYVQNKREYLSRIMERMNSASGSILSAKQRRFVSLAAKLDAMSPLKVLTRGYSMAQTPDGALIRSVNQIDTNDQIAINFCDGAVTAVVTGKEHFNESN